MTISIVLRVDVALVRYHVRTRQIPLGSLDPGTLSTLKLSLMESIVDLRTS
jgi:hypothetical protein